MSVTDACHVVVVLQILNHVMYVNDRCPSRLHIFKNVERHRPEIKFDKPITLYYEFGVSRYPMLYNHLCYLSYNRKNTFGGKRNVPKIQKVSCRADSRGHVCVKFTLARESPEKRIVKRNTISIFSPKQRGQVP